MILKIGLKIAKTFHWRNNKIPFLTLNFWLRSSNCLVGFMATERDSRAIFDILNFLSNVFILEQLRRKVPKFTMIVTRWLQLVT